MTKQEEEIKLQLDRIEKSVNQMRSYFLWTLIITVVVIVLPIIGLAFLIPQVLSTYSNLGL